MKVAITGTNGRMGKMLIEAVLQSNDMQLCAALVRPNDPAIGTDAGAFLGQHTGVQLTDDLSALQAADCLIDFTLPEGTMRHLAACQKYGTQCVIGTTGFDNEQRAAIARAAEDIAIVFAPNMSIGVNIMLKLVEVAAQLMNEGFDAEIFEAHHRNKIDAPSGTALAMGETIAQAWGQELADSADWTRHGVTGAREEGRIGFSVVRGGDIVGDHTAFFCGQGERIEITHRSNSRATFAQGSLRAARFLANKKTGLYTMHDVLGL